MSGRNVYAICEDDCLIQTYTAEQITTLIQEAVEGGVTPDPDGAIISKIKEIRANGATQLWVGTEAEFNALNPAPTIHSSFVRIGTDGVMYLCTDDSEPPSKPVAFTVTLTTAGWSSSRQTVYSELFVASGYAYTISPSTDGFSAYAGAAVRAQDVSIDGQCTFVCDSTPAGNTVVNILRTEVVL